MPSLTVTVEQQFFIFLFICFLGLLISFFLDILRAWSKAFRISPRALFLLDLFFCLAAALFLWNLLFILNQGEVRFYIFVALIMGVAGYYLFLSPYIYEKMLKTLLKIIKAGKDFYDKGRNVFINKSSSGKDG